jgi:hypothetical protein
MLITACDSLENIGTIFRFYNDNQTWFYNDNQTLYVLKNFKDVKSYLFCYSPGKISTFWISRSSNSARTWSMQVPGNL